jgi:hypothetical protein
MREPIETLTHLVVASGRSTKHIRKMSDSIVQAVGHILKPLMQTACDSRNTVRHVIVVTFPTTIGHVKLHVFTSS